MPVYNAGQAIFILLVFVALVLLGLFSDPVLAVYVGVGAYLGSVASALLLGLYPMQAEIDEAEAARVAEWLDSSSLLERIGSRVWAGRHYRSHFWASDWIRIDAIPGASRLCLSARSRDMRLALEWLDGPG